MGNREPQKGQQIKNNPMTPLQTLKEEIMDEFSDFYWEKGKYE